MIDEQTLERVIEIDGHLCSGVAKSVLIAPTALRDIVPVLDAPAGPDPIAHR